MSFDVTSRSIYFDSFVTTLRRGVDTSLETRPKEALVVARRFVQITLLASAALLLAGCWELNNPVDPLAEGFQGYRVYKPLELSFGAPSVELIEGDRETVSLFATYEDGSRANVSAQATLTVGESSIAEVEYRDGALLVTALRPGATVVNARYSGLSTESGGLAVRVRKAGLSRIEVSPSSRTIPAGVSSEFAVVGVYPSGEREELTDGVTWTLAGDGVTGEASADGKFTAVATQPLASGSKSAVLNAFVTTTNGTNLSSSASVSVSKAVLESISVAQDGKSTTDSIPLGRSLKLAAFGTYSDGAVYPLAHASGATWSSSHEQAIEISNDSHDWGTAKAVGLSKTPVTLSVALGDVASGDESLSLAVSPPSVDRIEIVPPTDPIYHGGTIDLTVRGYLSDGSGFRELEEVRWSVPDAESAVSVVAGRLQADGHGTARIEAHYDDLEAEIVVTVLPIVSLLSVDAAKTQIAVGGRTELFVTARYSDGSTAEVGLDGGTAWTVSPVEEAGAKATGTAPATVTIEDGGVFATGVAPGMARIVAVFATGGANLFLVEGSIEITVVPADVDPIIDYVRIELPNPPEDGVLPVGAETPVRAIIVYEDGEQADRSADVTWSVGDNASIELRESGERGGYVLVGAKEGNTGEITAILGERRGTHPGIPIGSPRIVGDLEIHGPTRVPVGTSSGFSATAMFTNGPGSVDAKSLSWSIVGPDFVSIDGDGILTAGAGHFIGAEGATVTVVAKAEGYDGSEGGAAVEARRSVLLVRELSALRVTDVTVRRPNGSQARSVPLTTDRITVPSGHLLSFSVTAEFTDGSTEIVSSGIEWSWKGVGIDPGRLTTANPAKATFRATAPGEVDVRGSYTHGYAGETRSRIATVGVSVVSPSARAWKHPSVRWKARNALPDTP